MYGENIEINKTPDLRSPKRRFGAAERPRGRRLGEGRGRKEEFNPLCRQVFGRIKSSPVEFSRLAELVLPLVEPGHAQSIFGRNVRTQHLLNYGRGVGVISQDRLYRPFINPKQGHPGKTSGHLVWVCTLNDGKSGPWRCEIWRNSQNFLGEQQRSIRSDAK